MSSPEGEREPDDQGWIVLTEGMDPYERFRYIATKVLEKALREAEPYAVDERLFEEVADADEDEVKAHLESLDEQLSEDEEITDLEHAFLCATVGSVLEDHGGEARCYSGLLRLSRASEDGLGPFEG